VGILFAPSQTRLLLENDCPLFWGSDIKKPELHFSNDGMGWDFNNSLSVKGLLVFILYLRLSKTKLSGSAFPAVAQPPPTTPVLVIDLPLPPYLNHSSSQSDRS